MPLWIFAKMSRPCGKECSFRRRAFFFAVGRLAPPCAKSLGRRPCSLRPWRQSGRGRAKSGMLRDGRIGDLRGGSLLAFGGNQLRHSSPADPNGLPRSASESERWGISDQGVPVLREEIARGAPPGHSFRFTCEILAHPQPGLPTLPRRVASDRLSAFE